MGSVGLDHCQPHQQFHPLLDREPADAGLLFLGCLDSITVYGHEHRRLSPCTEYAVYILVHVLEHHHGCTSRHSRRLWPSQGVPTRDPYSRSAACARISMYCSTVTANPAQPPAFSTRSTKALCFRVGPLSSALCTLPP